MQKMILIKTTHFCINGDNPILQTGIQTVLKEQLPYIELLPSNAPGGAAPTILILCVSNPERTMPLLERYRQRYSNLKTLLLYENLSPGEVFPFFLQGCGCLARDTLSFTELMDCIQLLENGYVLWDPELKGLFSQEAEKYHRFLECLQAEIHFSTPTGRELEIAKAILAGCSNEQIAQQLYLSPGTVKNCIAAILEKYNLKTRAQIVGLLAL